MVDCHPLVVLIIVLVLCMSKPALLLFATACPQPTCKDLYTHKNGSYMIVYIYIVYDHVYCPDYGRYIFILGIVSYTEMMHTQCPDNRMRPNLHIISGSTMQLVSILS